MLTPTFGWEKNIKGKVKGKEMGRQKVKLLYKDFFGTQVEVKSSKKDSQLEQDGKTLLQALNVTDQMKVPALIVSALLLAGDT